MRFPISVKDKITGATVVSITETGKRLAEKFASRGPNFAILSSLCEKQKSISELSIDTGIEITELKQRVKILKNQEYVHLTGIEA